MKAGRFWAWLTFGVGAAYFFIPLIATLEFSMRMRRGVYSFDAYQVVLGDVRFQQTFGYSVLAAIFTIILGVLLVVPTAYWIRLRMPHLRPVVEFITLLPLVIPAIVIVFGYIRMYGSNSPLPFLASARGTDVLLVIGYATLALPYMYRAVDTGLQDHRRAHADRGRADPRRRLDDDHHAGHPAERADRGAVGRVPDLRDRDRRIHHGEPAQPAGLRPLSAEHRRQPRL